MRGIVIFVHGIIFLYFIYINVDGGPTKNSVYFLSALINPNNKLKATMKSNNLI